MIERSLEQQPNAFSSDTANTLVGSAAGLVSAAGATAVAVAFPVAGAVLTVVGAGVAAGALYRKLAGKTTPARRIANGS